jgi:hypothetical protein
LLVVEVEIFWGGLTVEYLPLDYPAGVVNSDSPCPGAWKGSARRFKTHSQTENDSYVTAVTPKYSNARATSTGPLPGLSTP